MLSIITPSLCESHELYWKCQLSNITLPWTELITIHNIIKIAIKPNTEVFNLLNNLQEFTDENIDKMFPNLKDRKIEYESIIKRTKYDKECIWIIQDKESDIILTPYITEKTGFQIKDKELHKDFTEIKLLQESVSINDNNFDRIIPTSLSDLTKYPNSRIRVNASIYVLYNKHLKKCFFSFHTSSIDVLVDNLYKSTRLNFDFNDDSNEDHITSSKRRFPTWDRSL